MANRPRRCPPPVLEIVGPTLIVAARETMNARLTSLLVWLLLAGSLDRW
jgi:hypothetical protein